MDELSLDHLQMALVAGRVRVPAPAPPPPGFVTVRHHYSTVIINLLRCPPLVIGLLILQEGYRGRFEDKVVQNLREYFSNNTANCKRPSVAECRKFLEIYPNPRMRSAKNIRDKMRNIIPIKDPNE
jgi:hypothetical protein